MSGQAESRLKLCTSWRLTLHRGTDIIARAATEEVVMRCLLGFLCVCVLGVGLLGCGGEPNRGWTTPEQISEFGRGPQLAVDPDGNALVVWTQTNDTPDAEGEVAPKSFYPGRLWASRYTPSDGWGAAETMGRTWEGGAGAQYEVVMDVNGNGVAVWWDGASDGVWANRYTPTGAWGTEERIESISGQANGPKVTFDPNGNALAIWSQWDGSVSVEDLPVYSIWANRYSPSDGWGVAELLENNEERAHSPQLATDADGNAVAVWCHWDDSLSILGLRRYSIWANRYTATGGWGTAELVENAGAWGQSQPQIAMNADGDAQVIWSQRDGAEYSIWAKRYSPTGAWGVAERVDADRGAGPTRRHPQVAVDANGNALALWQQGDDGTAPRYDIWANRYTWDDGWGVPELIETDDLLTASGARLAIDPMGNGLAVWLQYDRDSYPDGSAIWANRYRVSGGWGAAERIENPHHSSDPALAMDANGNALVVWEAWTLGGIWGSWLR